MKIRKEQFERFEEASRSDFHRRLASFLRLELPEEVAAMDEATLLAYVARCDSRAQGRGVESEAGRAQFTCLTLLAGPEFDEIPDVDTFFGSTEGGLTPDQKVEILVDELASGRDPVR